MKISLTPRAFLMIGKAFAYATGVIFTGWLLTENSVILGGTIGALLLSFLNAGAGAAFSAELSQKQKLLKIGALPCYAACSCLFLLGVSMILGFIAQDLPNQQRLGLSAVPLGLALLLWIRAGTEWSYGEDKGDPYWKQLKGGHSHKGDPEE